MCFYLDKEYDNIWEFCLYECHIISGMTNMVYPGAVHSRFEHSLGVYWLAGEAVQKLKDYQVWGVIFDSLILNPHPLLE